MILTLSCFFICFVWLHFSYSYAFRLHFSLADPYFCDFENLSSRSFSIFCFSWLEFLLAIHFLSIPTTIPSSINLQSRSKHHLPVLQYHLHPLLTLPLLNPFSKSTNLKLTIFYIPDIFFGTFCLQYVLLAQTFSWEA